MYTRMFEQPKYETVVCCSHRISKLFFVPKLISKYDFAMQNYNLVDFIICKTLTTCMRIECVLAHASRYCQQ